MDEVKRSAKWRGKWNVYAAYDHTHIVAHLEKQTQQGWRLEDMTGLVIWRSIKQCLWYRCAVTTAEQQMIVLPTKSTAYQNMLWSAVFVSPLVCFIVLLFIF